MQEEQGTSTTTGKGGGSWFTPDRLILIVAIGMLAFFLYLRGCDGHKLSEKEAIELQNSLQDSIKILKHKDSTQTATISVLQTEKTSNFLNIKTKDSQIMKLQSVVKDYSGKLKAGNSATTALIETLAIERKKTGAIVYKDTVIYNDKLSYIYPEYRDTSDNGWVSYTQRMNKDSSFLDLKVRNSFSAVVGTEKGKLFQKGRPFVDLTLDNPYSEVKELRTYQVAMPLKKKIGIGFNVGFGFSGNLTPKPYVGVGISYNFIRL